VRAALRLAPARLVALAALTAAVYAIELVVVHRLDGRLPASTLGAVVTFDLALAVPFLWWLFGLRGQAGALRRLLPVVVASLAGAALVAPTGGRTLVWLLRMVLIPVELAAVVVTVRTVVGAVRLARSDADVAERLEDALTKALGDHTLARLLAAEASALFFAVLGGRRRAVGRPGESYTLHEARVPAVTWGLALVVVVESAVVHLLVAPAHPAIAWTLTGTGAYAILWLVGQDRALAARAITLDADHLVLRAGLRLTARIPWRLVSGVEGASWSTPRERSRGHADIARPGDANLVVRFREPVVVTRALGLRRRVSSVALCVDEPEGLRACIESRCA